MPRSASLSSEHFASKWLIPTKEDFYGYEDTNILGIKYANLPDGPDKEDLLLQLTKCFHGYLMKYLNMIVRGHLPPMNSSTGTEAVKFLKLLAPGGKTTTGSAAYGEICRTLHLAFKQCTTEDVYDSLLMCLMRAIKKYDPNYVEKLSTVCKAIDIRCKGKHRKVGQTPEFINEEIAKIVKADINSHLRKLVKRGHLVSITNSKKKVIGYRRNPEAWPPPASMFKNGPVGFTYAVQTYFRFYLHEYITRQMRNIESKEGMLQLDHRAVGDDTTLASSGIPHAEGSFVDTDGQHWAADTTLMNLSMDISTMNDDWVDNCSDKLFKELEKSDRHILYLTYVKEYSIPQIADIVGFDPKTVRTRRDEVMVYLKTHAQIEK